MNRKPGIAAVLALLLVGASTGARAGTDHPRATTRIRVDYWLSVEGAPTDRPGTLCIEAIFEYPRMGRSYTENALQCDYRVQLNPHGQETALAFKDLEGSRASYDGGLPHPVFKGLRFHYWTHDGREGSVMADVFPHPGGIEHERTFAIGRGQPGAPTDSFTEYVRTEYVHANAIIRLPELAK